MNEESLYRVLIVDDEASFRTSLRGALKKDYEVSEAATSDEAVRHVLEAPPDVVLLDIAMPGVDGLETLRKVREVDDFIAVIMVTAYGEIRNVVQAINQGAVDYLTKPIDLDELHIAIGKALERLRYKQEIAALRQALGREYTIDNLIGKSPEFLGALSMAKRVARSPDANVYIGGESGVGKELFARAIHFNSPRASGPFVAVNCAAINKEVVESELFGYKRGAFTGAHTKGKKGFFEEAHGGTLLLDEVADLPLDVQAKLLRVLEEKEFYPVGDSQQKKADVRVIATTNQPLEKLCETGQFRQDLYFRLATININITPLRERKDDILLLVNYFLDMFNKKYGKNFRRVSQGAVDILMSHSWKGNVRELKNAIERVTLLEDTTEVEQEHLDFLAPRLPHTPSVKREAEQYSFPPSRIPDNGIHLDEVIKDIISTAYKQTGRNQVQTAKLLGITRNTLLYRLKKYGIR
ncbi:MAG: sigma-54-dependent Fis family transcriptional regulator [Deltaproteobacteria bacterium]|nr:MAG: sigma-54-dependent Fis family transcriptional regulator [Deltaproteobacteria bacterium]